MKDLNCYLHTEIHADYRCANCGAAICAECYDLSTKRMCAGCLEKGIKEEEQEASSVLATVNVELKKIYAGLIVGAVLSVALLILLYIEFGVQGLAMGAFWAIFIPAICGSLGTLLKRLFAGLKDSGDDGWWLAILLMLFGIAVAPITTIVRIVRRVKDVRFLKEVIDADHSALAYLAKYVQHAESGAVTPLAAALPQNTGVASRSNAEMFNTIKSR